MPVLLLVTALSGCAHTLRPEDWNQAIPKGDCTVRTVSPQQAEEESVEHYTADGRLLSGRGPIDDGKSWFWFQYQYDAHGRLLAFTEYEDRKHESFPCEVLGGCETPATRVIRRQRFFHDAAGRVIRKESSEETYSLQDNVYRGDGPAREQRRYTYDAEGRLVSIERGGATRHLEYSAGRLVRSALETRHSVKQVTAKYDGQGRISELEERDCLPKTGQCDEPSHAYRFRYDDAGRLIRQDSLDSTGLFSEDAFTWEYDGRGRITAVTQVQVVSRTGHVGRSIWEFTYDDLGRLTAFSVGGQVTQELSYSGACERVSKPRWTWNPSVLQDFGIED
jgi:YD repeat-containing protein